VKREIDAASSDRTLLYSSLQFLSDPKNHKILDTQISKEPLAVTIPENDSEWADVVIIAGFIPTLLNPDDHEVLNNVISKEPLALALDENQSAWGDLVRWVTYSLVQAEELGINSENIQNLVAINTDSGATNDSIRYWQQHR
jgi:hypothetical protein